MTNQATGNYTPKRRANAEQTEIGARHDKDD
jgi:hypothetical protein